MFKPLSYPDLRGNIRAGKVKKAVLDNVRHLVANFVHQVNLLFLLIIVILMVDDKMNPTTGKELVKGKK